MAKEIMFYLMLMILFFIPLGFSNVILEDHQQPRKLPSQIVIEYSKRYFLLQPQAVLAEDHVGEDGSTAALQLQESSGGSGTSLEGLMLIQNQTLMLTTEKVTEQLEENEDFSDRTNYNDSSQFYSKKLQPYRNDSSLIQLGSDIDSLGLLNETVHSHNKSAIGLLRSRRALKRRVFHHEIPPPAPEPYNESAVRKAQRRVEGPEGAQRPSADHTASAGRPKSFSMNPKP